MTEYFNLKPNASLIKLNKISVSYAENILSKSNTVCDADEVKSKRKLNKVSSAISGLIVSLVNESDDILNHFEEIYLKYLDNSLMIKNIFEVSSLEEMWEEKYRYIATRIINTPCQGLGTPNAASGCGELFILMTSSDFSRPKKGDVMYLESKIEVKMGGKLNSLPLSGKELNDTTINFVKDVIGKYNILPICSRGGNKGKKQFLLPDNKEDLRSFLSKLTDLEKDKVIRHWFNSQKLKWDLEKDKMFLSWECIKEDWLKAVFKNEFKNFDIMCVLTQKENSTISSICKNYDELFNWYMSKENENKEIECRAFQKNSTSPYLGESYDKQKTEKRRSRAALDPT